MKLVGEQYKGSELVGTKLWVFRFDQATLTSNSSATAAAAGPGLWVEAQVTAYNDKLGEHEVSRWGCEQQKEEGRDMHWCAKMTADAGMCEPWFTGDLAMLLRYQHGGLHATCTACEPSLVGSIFLAGITEVVPKQD